MALRLTKNEVLTIQNNGELMGRLSHADIIAVERGNGQKPLALWMRPQEEIVARGLPAKIETITFEVDDQEDIDRLQAVVDRLKNGV